MFGIIYLTAILGALGINGIKTSIENELEKQKSIALNKETYMDNNLCSRLVSNNAKVMRCHIYTPGPYCEYKDDVLKYVGKDIIVRNFSKEERDKTEKKNYEKANERGRTTYRLGGKRDYHCQEKIKGSRYKDINSGDIYVVRYVKKRHYFMNLETGKFVRITDGQKEIDEKYKITFNDRHIISCMNKDQNQHIKRWGYINYFNEYNFGGRDYGDYYD